jgi:hypothetical protein
VTDCTVSVRDGNGEIDTVAVEASSVFDAVEQAMRQWARLWWYRGDLVAEVRAGQRRWRVRLERVGRWTAEKQGRR